VTWKEICEAWMRRCGIPEERVAEEAKAFWDSDPQGGLTHVFVAAKILADEGRLRADPKRL